MLVNPSTTPKISTEGRVRSESSRLKVGFADTIGRRPFMEDEIVIVGHLRGKADEDFVAVFDGHGGKEASGFASRKMHQVLEEKLNTLSTPEEALRAAFLETNALMKKENVQGGTTALCALFIGDSCYVANAGDSRGVLVENGVAIRYTIDHRPDLAEEEKRVRELGGTITTSVDKYGKVTTRLAGRLAVSRSLGDFSFEPYISAEPQIRGPFHFGQQKKDFFLILACDGLWDKLSDEEAAKIAIPIQNPERAAARLRDVAYGEGSDDNITVIVVRFPPFDDQ